MHAKHGYNVITSGFRFVITVYNKLRRCEKPDIIHAQCFAKMLRLDAGGMGIRQTRALNVARANMLKDIII